MRKELIISVAAHVVVLTLCMLTFVATPKPIEPGEAVAVDVVSSSDLSNMANGVKDKPQVVNPQPFADKVGDPKSVEDPLAKLANKEIKAATDTPPVPERKPPDPKPKKPAPAPPQADPIAEALKKDDQKSEPKKAEVVKPEVKPPAAPKKPEAPAFDPRQVAALLDKRTPQRTEATAPIVNDRPGFSMGTGGASHNSANDYGLGLMQARLVQLWNLPADFKEDLSLDVDVRLKRDGTLAAPPVVTTRGSGPQFLAAKDAAIRAVYQGQPYTMLRPEFFETYDSEAIITFHREVGDD